MKYRRWGLLEYSKDRLDIKRRILIKTTTAVVLPRQAVAERGEDVESSTEGTLKQSDSGGVLLVLTTAWS